MNILVTGSAGFIGYNLANYLLKKKHRVYGIDNFDTYYSTQIKKRRIKILKKNNNFFFDKVDITNKKKIKLFFKDKKIDVIIHLAAQAGVRYSFENPEKYIDVNIFGFLNLINEANQKKIKKILYASSSSVYGESTNFPLKETEPLNPKNIYGISKKLNEEIAEMYQKIYKMKFIGLRFFTVYGEWGRPDMFMLKLFKAHMNNNIFYLNNYGNHLRDFTYVGDIVKIVYKLISIKLSKHEVFNLCSNKPVNIYDIVKKFKKDRKVKVKLVPMHKADILKTHGSNHKIKKYLKKIKYSKFYDCFYQTFNWYRKNKIYKH